jgi:hypothetical protein
MPARTHDSETTIFTEITVDGAMVRVRLTLSSLPDSPFFESMKNATRRAPGTYAPFAQAIASHVLVRSGNSPCRAGRQYIEPPTPISASLSASVDYACQGPIRQLDLTNDLFDVFGNDLHMMARIDWGSNTYTFAFGPDLRRWTGTTREAQEQKTADLDMRPALIAAAIAVALGLAALGLIIRRRN